MDTNSTTSTKPKSPRQSAKDRKKPQTTRGELYREKKIINLSDNKLEVEYIPISIQQVTIFRKIIINSFIGMLFTESDRQNKKPLEVQNTIFEYFINTIKNGTEEEKLSLAVNLLFNCDNLHSFYELISNCFPGIDPTMVKQNYYIDMIQTIMYDFIEYLKENK